MVCFHNRYTLGDKTDFNKADYNSWEEFKQNLIDTGAKYIAPLYLYDHGGISIKIGSFLGKAPHADWDSGPVGFIYTTEEDIAAMGVDPDKVEDILSNEVDIYDKYIRGEVYGYQVIERRTCPTCSHIEKEVVESCWGFYSEEDARKAGEEFL